MSAFLTPTPNGVGLCCRFYRSKVTLCLTAQKWPNCQKCEWRNIQRQPNPFCEVCWSMLGFLTLGLVKYCALPTYSGQENTNLHPDSPNPASQIPRLLRAHRLHRPKKRNLENSWFVIWQLRYVLLFSVWPHLRWPWVFECGGSLGLVIFQVGHACLNTVWGWRIHDSQLSLSFRSFEIALALFKHVLYIIYVAFMPNQSYFKFKST